MIFGATAGDQQISNNQQPNGYKIHLYHNFPFYTGRYNYTLVGQIKQTLFYL